MAEQEHYPSQEALWLRENWGREDIFGIYDGKWIAVKDNKVIGSSGSAEEVIDAFQSYDPLFAFVHLGAF